MPIAPGEQKTVTFSLSADDLEFYDIDMEFVAEPGDFFVMAGPNSSDLHTARFSQVEKYLVPGFRWWNSLLAQSLNW